MKKSATLTQIHMGCALSIFSDRFSLKTVIFFVSDSRISDAGKQSLMLISKYKGLCVTFTENDLFRDQDEDGAKITFFVYK